MQTVYVLAIISFAFFMEGCSSSGKTSGISTNKQKVNGKSFHKLFILVAISDIMARVRLEQDLSATAASEGYTTLKSLDMIPFSLQEPKLPSKEEVELKVKESGCDAVLIVTLKHKKESLTYTPGANRNANSQILAGMLSGILNKSGSVEPVPSVSIPGNYNYGVSSFIIQSNLFDVSTQELMFSAQSNTFEISSLYDISKTYSSSLITQLKKENWLKK